VYNRPGHLKQCIQSLASCELAKQTTVYISSDAAGRREDEDAVKEVREYIPSISGFHEVIPIFHSENRGLLKAYSKSFEMIFERYDRLIFLEDDVLVAPDFLSYMNDAFSFYRTDERVYSISAFSFSVFSEVEPALQNQVYFANRFLPWGFGIWKHRVLNGNEYSLDDVKNDLKDSDFVDRLNQNGQDLYPALLSLVSQNKMLVLDYLQVYHMVKHRLVTVMPYVSKSFNIGNDGSGTRTKRNRKFQNIDIAFLKKKNPYYFTDQVQAFLDFGFYEENFNSKKNYYKMALYRLGLLGLSMWLLNFYKKNF
jgi:hypothetical protein